MLGQFVGAVLRAGEHQHLRPVVLLDKMSKQITLSFTIYWMHYMRYVVGGCVALRDLDHRRLVEQIFRQRPDLIGKGGREQQVLPLFGQKHKYFFYITNETHVKHAVSFVQHQDFYVRKIERFLLYMIQKASWGGYQDIHAAFQAGNLRINADPAYHYHRT